MGDPLTLATNIVSGIVSRVKDVKRNHEECELLGSLAQKTLSVLEALEAKALSDPTATNIFERVHEALNEADKAIENCCTANVIYASLYSDDYSLRLKHAVRMLESSLAQTSLASFGMTAEIQSELAALSNQIRNARVEERAKTAEQTRALKDAFERAFNQHGQESMEVNSSIRDLIQKQSSSVDELKDELAFLKQRAYEAYTNKEKQREFELSQIIAVLSESLGEVHEAPRVSQTLKECLCCPISKDIMRDPVILKDSGMVYDRSSITKWLRLGHRYDPLTNVELVSRELVPNSALRDACQILLAQSECPNVVDNSRTEDAKRQVELGLCEGHGNFSVGETIIHASQLLVLSPNGILIGCTLYSGEELGTQENTLEIGVGKWDRKTHQFSFGDSRFNYHGNVEIKTNVQKQTVGWSGKVSKVDALDQEYDFNLNYAPPPIGNEIQMHPTILEMKGEIAPTSANIKYNSKLLVALERNRSVNGWIAFESPCGEYKSFGQISNGRWDENGTLQFFVYFSTSNIPLNSDSKPTNYTSCFSVVGTMTQGEKNSCPSFSAIPTKAQGQGVMGQDKSTSTPLDGLELIKYSLIREASTPWHYLHPNPLKLFQLSRSFELEHSKYTSKANLDARYALISHSQLAKGRSPLHIAAENNYIQIVKEFITKGVDINFKDQDGQTPLHLASSSNSIDVIKILIENKANIDVQDNDGKSPLHVASTNNAIDVLKELIANGANVDHQTKNGCTPLYIASEKNSIDAIKELIANGANVDLQRENGWTPLHIASKENSLDAIEKLVVNGANIEHQSKDGLTPLQIASYHNHIEVVKELIVSGANIDHQTDNGDTPLFVASEMNSIDVVKELVAKGANVDHQRADGCTSLCIASEKNSIDTVKELIANRANIDLQTNSGWTPLQIASQHNHSEVVKELIVSGANVDHQRSNGNTSLYIASATNSIDAIKELIANGANIDHQTNSGCTPLSIASEKNSIDAVKQLLSKGANVDLQTKSGWTPLHYASAYGRVYIVKLLLNHGASKLIRNNSGKTPYNVVCANESFGPYEDLTINELKELLKI